MKRAYKTEGFILKRINFSETDRILTIFTKHYGKIKSIAKGIRQLKSRRAGSLELFNQVSLCLSAGKNFDIVTEAEVIESFANFRQRLDWVGYAFQIVEVTDKLTAERQPNYRVFDLLKRALASLDSAMVLKFEIRLLKELGFGLPKDLSAAAVENFIENIIEKRLKSKNLFPIH